ncbi:hypothetical protein [Devriesea agamarum]|uniref:hypothetical protein n=1 Tax=Devriesea agamarum TaxID=472569 RepID=UPI00071C7D00|nr:hypothetical protein [Devriesea agamarum]
MTNPSPWHVPGGSPDPAKPASGSEPVPPTPPAPDAPHGAYPPNASGPSSFAVPGGQQPPYGSGYGPSASQYQALQRELVSPDELFPIRPLSLGEILGAAFRTVRVRPKALFGMSALVLGIAQLVLLPLMLFGGNEYFSAFGGIFTGSFEGSPTSANDIDGGGILIFVITTLISATAYGLVTIMLSAAISGFVKETLVKQPPSVREFWQIFKRHAWHALATGILIGLIVGVPFTIVIMIGFLPMLLGAGFSVLGVLSAVIGMLVAILLSIFLGTRTVLALPSLATEGLGPWQAIRRSFALTSGNRIWRILGISILIALLMGLLQEILSFVPSILSGLISAVIVLTTHGEGMAAATNVSIVIGTLSSVAIYTLIQPFNAAALTVLYYDARMRQNAYDIELLREVRAARGQQV